MINTNILHNVNREIECKSLDEFIFHQGYYHFIDRALQMESLRIIASGRISECLQDNDETLAIDIFMRDLGIYHYSKLEKMRATKEQRDFLQNYCDGINEAIKKKTPWEFKLLGHHIKPFKIEDILATIRIMSYMGLAQGQQDLEKIIISMIHGGCDIEKIASYFNIPIDQLDTKRTSMIKKLNIYNHPFPKNTKFIQALPKIQASNNWISNLGKSVQMACDPHLEVNRLPSVWYEMSAKIKDKNYFGITMPGVPGFIMGRNNKLCYSFTYGFMDQIDYFIEEVRDDKIRSSSQFIKIETRKEIIKRKKHLDYDLYVSESENGTIECDSSTPNFSDGFYLSRAWSVQKSGCLETLMTLKNMFEIESAEEAVNELRNVCISCNWLVGDSEANIYYQQSGILPDRGVHGLSAGLGWLEEHRWKGFVPAEQLQHDSNPQSGVFVTANHKIEYGKSQSPEDIINSPMSTYRRDSIIDKLNKLEHNVENFMDMQNCLTSFQAKRYIEEYQELRDDENFENWDYSYHVDSKIAPLFEQFYEHLINDFMSFHFLDKNASAHLKNETCFFADFYDFFDQLFIGNKDSEIFFNEKSKQAFVLDALKKVENKDERWGDINKLDMNNLFFDGKIPAFLGFDQKNVEIPGNRATISQGAVYNSHGRKSSFCPSWRFVSDFKSNRCYSHLPGGLSDRRFSKNYKADIVNWAKHQFREYQI